MNDSMEVTVWVDDTPVSVTVEAPDLSFEQGLKALYVAGQEDVLQSLIEQAFDIQKEEEKEDDVQD